MNRLVATDAYHLSMGYLMGEAEALQPETHILYARSGGPLVVPNLSEVLTDYFAWRPSGEDVDQAQRFWSSQGIPFAVDIWRSFMDLPTLPILVRGVTDGEVVLPGDPIAVVQAPAIMAAVPEPYFIGRLMKSMQVATRFTKLSQAVGWERQRLFEVGMRAANSIEDHIDSIRTLERVGLRMTSSGVAGAKTGIATGGSMGHRYTQRFSNDYQAYIQAIDRMLAYKYDRGDSGKVKLSLLLDTRNTLQSGLPAAIKVIQERHDQIKQHLELSVRLDSGDMVQQLSEIIRRFQQELPGPEVWPAIIVESGLTAEVVARFEQVGKAKGYPREKLLYGVGGYLVGGIQRDFISLVYKVSSYNGEPTMKFADERQRGKESYPGNVTLMEKSIDGRIQRLVALREESDGLSQCGWREVFVNLIEDGRYCGPRFDKKQRIAFIERRWQQVSQGYLGDEKYPREFPSKPRLSTGVARLAERLRAQQLNIDLPNLVAIRN